MKLAVVGSRTFSDYYLLEDIIDKINPQTIISGGANGADKLAERYAINRNKELVVFKPNWEKYGKSAGFIRNNLIVVSCEKLIAFWDGKSKGTKHSIKLAENLNKLHSIIYFE